MVVPMSSAGSANKHRHDIGHPDHGPKTTDAVTKTIQGVMAATIIATVLLIAYAVFAVATSSAPTPPA